MCINLICPHCRTEFNLYEGRNDADWYELNGLIFSLPEIIHRPLWRYLELFKGKNKLSSAKLLGIVKQLHPMIKEAQVTRNKVSHVVPPKFFAAAMNQLVENPPDTLTLPLKGNGYLLSMLVSQTEKAAAKQEIRQEQQRFKQPRTGQFLPKEPNHDNTLKELKAMEEKLNRKPITGEVQCKPK